jgi:ABC-type uncharacterized transport system substrate-binding protein
VDRRAFLAGTLALLSGRIAAEAQPAPPRAKAARLAIVSPTAVPAMTEAAPSHYRAFHMELRRLGWVEGQTLGVERRSAEGQRARYAELAREVVALKPDVILANSTTLALAFKAATTTIPIVAIASGLVETGLVSSLAHPGGNITGVSVDAGLEIHGKRLQILKEVMPAASRIAFLVSSAGWAGAWGQAMRDAARHLGLTLAPAVTHDPHDERAYALAFEAMTRAGAEAQVVSDSSENFVNRRLISELAAQARIPAMHGFKEAAQTGALMAYAANLADVWRQSAGYVDRILRGARPGDLPIAQPTTFDLVVNLKTARALGLTIPPSVLARADEVIR